MTATLPQAPARPGRRPQRPALAGLCWVAWRQHRTALLATLAALLVGALALVFYGLPMHRDFATLNLAACVPGTGSEAGHVSRTALQCTTNLEIFHNDQNRVNQLTALFLPLPVIFGLFLGAPMLAREYESGTYRFTFTQGAGRTRWLVTKICLLTVLTIASTAAFTALVMWWYAPLVPLDGRLGSDIQEIYGAVFVARAVFALALGILAGAVLRRVVSAIGATLVVWTGVVIASITAIRPHLLTPLTGIDLPGTPNGWIIGDVWKSPTGTALNPSQVAEDMYSAAQAGHKFDGDQYLFQHGYVRTTIYQPAGRFWELQSVEAGCLMILSAGLLLAAVWLVRRRAA